MQRTKGILGIAAVAAVAVILPSAVGRAASITSVGAQLDFEVNSAGARGTGTAAAAAATTATGGWRVPDATPGHTGANHAFLVGSNTIYGTDGYKMFNADVATAVLPTYVGSVSGGPNSFGPSDGYSWIVNPTTNNTEMRSGTYYVNGAAAQTQQTMFTFTTAAAGAVPSRIRVGMLFDNTDGTQANIQMQLTGGGGDSGLVLTTQGAAPNSINQKPDWYFFDINNAANSETYSFILRNNEATAARGLQIGGIAFDSTPEPGSLSLLGLGALGLLARRRRHA